MKVSLLLLIKKVYRLLGGSCSRSSTEHQCIQFHQGLLQILIVLADQGKEMTEKSHESTLVLHYVKTAMSAYEQKTQVLKHIPLVQARVMLQQVLD